MKRDMFITSHNSMSNVEEFKTDDDNDEGIAKKIKEKVQLSC